MFQSSPPSTGGDAPDGRAAPPCGSPCFNPRRPQRAATRSASGASGGRSRCFNPRRPQRAATPRRRRSASTARSRFNPRRPQRAATRASPADRSWACCECSNPRRPQRAATQARASSPDSASTRFNPRRPQRAATRVAVVVLRGLHAVSILAALNGWRRMENAPRVQVIPPFQSSPPSTGGDASVPRKDAAPPTVFQSSPPQPAATLLRVGRMQLDPHVSILAALNGRRRHARHRAARRVDVVSILAALNGRRGARLHVHDVRLEDVSILAALNGRRRGLPATT